MSEDIIKDLKSKDVLKGINENLEKVGKNRKLSAVGYRPLEKEVFQKQLDRKMKVDTTFGIRFWMVKQ